jgi:uncharacterized protein YuzE
MNFKYDPETDSLYIHLNRSRSVKTIRVSAHIQIDIGKDGTPVGINLENVSDYSDLRVDLENLRGPKDSLLN